ncbi:MAG: TlyA family RNA methyltransferase [Oscillospiraceae bacterium]|nr:TlyA family RNA methyltransferase [Oscillospiraceae bacterium]
MENKRRLDVLMVERKLADTREKARMYIKSGWVKAAGKTKTKPGEFVAADEAISLNFEREPYVSRGGVKLEKALVTFGIDLTGKVCIDIGASTGGFTDCMLRSGAKTVYAIDVGSGQLDNGLRQDDRVISHENTDIREFSGMPGFPSQNFPADFAAVDVSFISLRLVLPSVKPLIARGGSVVVLVKPQFEAGRENIQKRGIVKDEKAHKEVLETVITGAAEIGLYAQGLEYSPSISKGENKNIEFLLHLKLSAPQTTINRTRIETVIKEAKNIAKERLN